MSKTTDSRPESRPESRPAPRPHQRGADSFHAKHYLDWLLSLRPLESLSHDDFEDFLLAARMYASNSRFAPPAGQRFAPRRDTSVKAALNGLRVRVEQAAAAAQLVAHVERDYEPDDALADDDEALVVAASIRDTLRQALAMLGVVELALEEQGVEVRGACGRVAVVDEGEVVSA